jgi:hypothetical protein
MLRMLHNSRQCEKKRVAPVILVCFITYVALRNATYKIHISWTGSIAEKVQ